MAINDRVTAVKELARQINSGSMALETAALQRFVTENESAFKDHVMGFSGADPSQYYSPRQGSIYNNETQAEAGASITAALEAMVDPNKLEAFKRAWKDVGVSDGRSGGTVTMAEAVRDVGPAEVARMQREIGGHVRNELSTIDNAINELVDYAKKHDVGPGRGEHHDKFKELYQKHAEVFRDSVPARDRLDRAMIDAIDKEPPLHERMPGSLIDENTAASKSSKSGALDGLRKAGHQLTSPNFNRLAQGYDPAEEQAALEALEAQTQAQAAAHKALGKFQQGGNMRLAGDALHVHDVDLDTSSKGIETAGLDSVWQHRSQAAVEKILRDAGVEDPTNPDEVKAFQEKQGLRADGFTGSRTLEAASAIGAIKALNKHSPEAKELAGKLEALYNENRPGSIAALEQANVDGQPVKRGTKGDAAKEAQTWIQRQAELDKGFADKLKTVQNRRGEAIDVTRADWTDGNFGSGSEAALKAAQEHYGALYKGKTGKELAATGKVDSATLDMMAMAGTKAAIEATNKAAGEQGLVGQINKEVYDKVADIPPQNLEVADARPAEGREQSNVPDNRGTDSGKNMTA